MCWLVFGHGLVVVIVPLAVGAVDVDVDEGHEPPAPLQQNMVRVVGIHCVCLSVFRVCVYRVCHVCARVCLFACLSTSLVCVLRAKWLVGACA